MRPDLRLAGLALGAWLAALAGLYLTARDGVLLGAGAALGGVLAGWLLRHRWRWVLAGALVGVACGALVTAARVATRDAPLLTGLARDRATVHMRLSVSDDPRAVRGRTVTFVVPASASEVNGIRLSVDVLVLATDPAWRGLLPGTSVEATGRLAPGGRGDLTAAVLSVSGPPDRVGVAPWTQRAAGALREGLRRACAPLPKEPGGLLPGLVDGDTSRLDPAVAEEFRATGMTHLLAVSGANVAIVLGAVLLAARWSRAGPRLAAVVCAVALVGFVILVRPSPSVLRAAAMGGLALLALALGRSRSAVPALAAPVIVLLCVDSALAGAAGCSIPQCSSAAHTRV